MPTPSHQPTPTSRRTVTVLIASGATHTTVARVLHITKATLRKYYKTEMANAHEMANATVVQRLFKSIMSGNIAATIFWLKCRAGWKEGVKVELDKPVPLSLESLSKDERSALRHLMIKAKPEQHDDD